MRKTCFAALWAGCMATSLPAFAAESDPASGTITSNIGVVTDYVSRGLSQTRGNPAVQGGVDWAMTTENVDPYFGVWASNVNGADALGLPGAELELDLYGGVLIEMFRASVDVGMYYYVYPGEEGSFNPNYNEFKIGISFPVTDSVSIKSLYYYSPNYFGLDTYSHYFNGEVVFAPPQLPWDLEFTASVGRSIFGGNGLMNRTDWLIGAAINLEIFEVSVAYTDSTDSESTCNKVCGGRIIGKISRSF